MKTVDNVRAYLLGIIAIHKLGTDEMMKELNGDGTQLAYQVGKRELAEHLLEWIQTSEEV